MKAFLRNHEDRNVTCFTCAVSLRSTHKIRKNSLSFDDTEIYSGILPKIQCFKLFVGQTRQQSHYVGGDEGLGGITRACRPAI